MPDLDAEKHANVLVDTSLSLVGLSFATKILVSANSQPKSLSVSVKSRSTTRASTKTAKSSQTTMTLPMVGSVLGAASSVRVSSRIIQSTVMRLCTRDGFPSYVRQVIQHIAQNDVSRFAYPYFRERRKRLARPYNRDSAAIRRPYRQSSHHGPDLLDRDENRRPRRHPDWQ